MNKGQRYCPKCREYREKRRIKDNGFKCDHCGYNFHKDNEEIPLR